MIGERSFLEDVQLCDRTHRMTFSDSVTAHVLGKVNMCVPGLPKLTNVCLVESLKANLISISQLCDENLFVRFTKKNCFVVNDREKCHGGCSIIRQLLSSNTTNNMSQGKRR